MSNTRKDVKLHLKVVFNKHKTKVLFAEADNHFTDTLLSFLMLPFGKLVKILQKHYGDDAPVIGSMNTLCTSLSNLDSSYFLSERCKRALLNPASPFSEECCMLKLDLSGSCPTRYFGCEHPACRLSNPMSLRMYCGTATCSCGKDITREIRIKYEQPLSCGAFTVNKATFLITDDLRVFPNVTASLVQIVERLGISQMDWGERTDVSFGHDEIMDLLKGSITCSTPLTDVVLKKGECRSALPEFHPRALSHKIKIKINKSFNNSPKTMALKAIVQKSTNRLLFVESDEDFVDFLLSLLTIPLGGVRHILGCFTPFYKNIINLQRSVADAIDGKFFECNDIRSRLTKLQLPYGYCFNSHLLPNDTDYMHHEVYYFRSHTPGEEYVSRSWYPGTVKVRVCTPKPKENSVRRAGMFKITDDLTVTPLSALDGLNVSLSDVAEQVFHIGLEEALSIMKASLISTSALSVVLGPMLMKQPKEGR